MNCVLSANTIENMVVVFGTVRKLHSDLVKQKAV